jgi:hypothetical protein
VGQGPTGRPGFESAQPGTWLTRLYVSLQGRIWGLKVVEAKRSGWPATWMAGRLSIHLLQTNLPKSVETPLCPYISPPMIEDSRTHSTCSFPLVKVWFSSRSAGETLLGVESRIENSLELQKLSRRSVSSCIFTFVYRVWVLVLICFILVFILSFDVCIVTSTWCRLFLVIALWVICPTW